MKLGQILMGLIGHLRAMQLYFHQEHNVAKGSGFFADHDAFAGFYAEVEADFDSIVEWAVSKGLTDCAFVKNHMTPVQAALKLNDAMEMEKQLCDLCCMVAEHEDCTLGLEQTVGDICVRSEVRQYKLGQRNK